MTHTDLLDAIAAAIPYSGADHLEAQALLDALDDQGLTITRHDGHPIETP